MLQSSNDECLEYVNRYCHKYLLGVDFDPETGEPELCPSGIPDYFLKRYNHLEMNEADFCNRYKDFTIPEGDTFEKHKRSISLKGTFTYKDYMEDKNFQELLQHKQINFDAEKFWYLLRFIYDYTWGQCMNGHKLTESCTDQLNSFSKAIFSNYEMFRPKTKQTLILYTDDKPCIKIDNPDAIRLLAQLWETYKPKDENSILELKQTNGTMLTESNLILTLQSTTGATLTESNGIQAFFSAQMFVDFFDIYSMDKKNGAKLSDKQKELISYFWYFTGIVSNSSVLASTEYFKAIWKRYKNYKPKSMNAFYI